MKTLTITSAVFTVFSLTCLTNAHMQMSDPPPLLSKFNKYTTNTDYDMTSPLHADGSNYPCKGYHQVLGTSQGQPVAQWTPGKSYSMTITGGAPHNGGSCQASLSFDKGNSWKVIHSYIGNCPVMGDSSYKFTLPSDTPSGKTLFAWTWFNNVGNREMYMNCAVIDVLGGKKRKKRGTAVSMTSRPKVFVANVGNGCWTEEGSDLMFPDPGPDVDMKSQSTAPPTGNCAAPAKYPVDTPVNSQNPSGPAPEPASSASDPVDPSPRFVDGSRATPSKAPGRTANTSMTWHGMSHPPTMSPLINMPTDAPAPSPSPSSMIPSVHTIWPPTSGSCKPGSFQCAASPSGGQGWKACDISGSWVYAGDCLPGQICKFNMANGSPYCVPPSFQFP